MLHSSGCGGYVLAETRSTGDLLMICTQSILALVLQHAWHAAEGPILHCQHLEVERAAVGKLEGHAGCTHKAVDWLRRRRAPAVGCWRQHGDSAVHQQLRWSCCRVSKVDGAAATAGRRACGLRPFNAAAEGTCTSRQSGLKAAARCGCCLRAHGMQIHSIRIMNPHGSQKQVVMSAARLCRGGLTPPLC